MELFLDTPDLGQINSWLATDLIDGVTTNPEILAKVGGDIAARVRTISSLLQTKPLSVEVTELEPEAVYQQALAIAAIGRNVFVKIPCHKDYFPVIARLCAQKIQLNITMVSSFSQGFLMSKLGVDYISLYVGRLADAGIDSIEILFDLCNVRDHYKFTTKILAASIHDVEQAHQAIVTGIDAITLPVDVLEKMAHHAQTDIGIQKFAQAWKKLGNITFP